MKSQIRTFVSQKLQGIRRNLRWFLPGLGVKRWMGVILAGTTLIGIGIGIYVLEIYRTSPDTWWLPLLSYASLLHLSPKKQQAVVL